MAKSILHLTLHRKWFDEIASGRKDEEYRDVTPYWSRRIENRDIREIHFRNGYRPDSPFMRVECRGWYAFTESPGKRYYVLILGRILEVQNYPPLLCASVSLCEKSL